MSLCVHPQGIRTSPRMRLCWRCCRAEEQVTGDGGRSHCGLGRRRPSSSTTPEPVCKGVSAGGGPATRRVPEAPRCWLAEPPRSEARRHGRRNSGLRLADQDVFGQKAAARPMPPARAARRGTSSALPSMTPFTAHGHDRRSLGYRGNLRPSGQVEPLPRHRSRLIVGGSSRTPAPGAASADLVDARPPPGECLVTVIGATHQPPPGDGMRPAAGALLHLANYVHAELVAAGFQPHMFLGAEETVDDWRRRGPLIVVRRDHVEVWWSVGPRPTTQAGPTYAERRMTPVLRDILIAAGIDAALSIPTRDGDAAVWVTRSRPGNPAVGTAARDGDQRGHEFGQRGR